ncbi:MAG: HU family DNA-binding protein [Candidatus Gastranaerophilales bacterium]|nr:HU family DNA-binding protein [Candidatus Gastranaerophilales bacterium]
MGAKANKRVNQREVIDRIRERTGFSRRTIKNILDSTRAVLVEEAQETTAEDVTQFILFDGVSFILSVVPERERRDPRNNTHITVPASVKVKGYFSYSFKQEINE